MEHLCEVLFVEYWFRSTDFCKTYMWMMNQDFHEQIFHGEKFFTSKNLNKQIKQIKQTKTKQIV